MPHTRTWMTWPAADYMLDGSCAPVESVWEAWASVANAIAEYQTVSMLVAPGQEAPARRRLSAAVEQFVVPVDDAWMCDSGPTFVFGASGSSTLAPPASAAR